MRTLLISAFLLLGLCLLPSCADSSAQSVSQPPADPEALLGTWRLSVAVDIPGFLPQEGLYSFHSGGTLTGVDASLHFLSERLPDIAPICACNGSTAHGVWAHLGGTRFTFTAEKLVYAGSDTAALGLNLSEPIVSIGQHIGYLLISGIEADVAGNTLTATGGTIQLLNLDRELLNPLVPPLDSTAAAERIIPGQ